MKTTEEPVIVEQTFDTSIEDVWEAITKVDRMHQWYFDNIPDFRAEVGFETRFDVVSGDRIFPHLWKVTEVDPGRKITYNWKFEGYPGDSDVTFELIETGGGTKLRVSANVIDDFSDDIPEFRRESCLGGWQYFIQQSLKDYLEKR